MESTIISSAKNSPVCKMDWFIKVKFIDNDKVEILKHYRMYGDEYDEWSEEHRNAYKSKFKYALTEDEKRTITHVIIKNFSTEKIYEVVNPRHIFSY